MGKVFGCPGTERGIVRPGVVWHCERPVPLVLLLQGVCVGGCSVPCPPTPHPMGTRIPWGSPHCRGGRGRCCSRACRYCAGVGSSQALLRARGKGGGGELRGPQGD